MKFSAQLAVVLFFYINNISSNSQFLIDDISKCLSSNNCDESRTCSNYIFEKSCLQVDINPWQDHNNIACCFKCCVNHFINAYDLAGDKISINTAQKSKFHLNFKPFSYKNILQSTNNAHSISTQIIVQGAISFGNISLFRFTSITTNNPNSWHALQGRRVVLLSQLSECVDQKVATSAMGTIAPFANPRISMWYSTQLPCGWKGSGSGVGSGVTDSSSIHDKQSSLSLSSELRKKHPHPSSTSTSLTVKNTIEGKLHIIPLGVRDDVVMNSVLNNNNNKGVQYSHRHRHKPHLLYCGCARTFSEQGAALVAMLTKRGLCSDNNPSTTSSTSSSSSSLYSEYSALLSYKYTLSPSYLTTNGDTSISSHLIQSHCEWEGLVVGAVPLISKPSHPLVQGLLDGLPLLQIEDWEASPYVQSIKQLNELYDQLQIQFSTPSTPSSSSLSSSSTSYSTSYSLSKAYFPYWLFEYTEHLVSGKPPARFFKDVKTALSRKTPKCTPRQVTSSTSSSSSRKLRNTDIDSDADLVIDIDSDADSNRTQSSSSSSVLSQGDAHRYLNDLQRSMTTMMSMSMMLRKESLQDKNNNMNMNSNSNKINRNSNNNKENNNNINGNNINNNNINSNNVPSVHLDLRTKARKRSHFRANHDPQDWATGVLGIAKTHRDIANRIGFNWSKYHIDPSHSSSVSSSVSSSSVLELVLPRCCEDGIEMQWLADLLMYSPSISVSIFYKCPACLPSSLVQTWSRDIASNAALRDKISRGIRVLDDASLVIHGSHRVRQYTNFDTIYNAKEVSAYLQHILTRYDTLSDHTMFLHTTPNAHVFFDLFYRTIRWITSCSQPVHFLHLNARYKSGAWGECCGRRGACRESTWKWLGMGNSGSVATYSSAQFVVSRESLQKKSKSFYTRMLLAINGSHDLHGCPANSEPGKTWGGHQLTGQYERMWHVIFGFKLNQPTRNRDVTLPQYLRVDCADWQCQGAV
eukprot:gene4507-8960_t